MPYRRLRETELLDAIAHLVAIDAQELPRMRLVALRALQRLHQKLPLDFFEPMVRRVLAFPKQSLYVSPDRD